MSPSFVAALDNAVLVGRRLIVAQDNTVCSETLLEKAGKHFAIIHDGLLSPDVVQCWPA